MWRCERTGDKLYSHVIGLRDEKRKECDKGREKREKGEKARRY